MTGFYANVIDYVDEADNVVGVFVQWSEYNEDLSGFVEKAMVALWLASMVSFYIATAAPYGALWAILALGMLGIAFAMAFSGLCYEPRELMLDANGAIAVPRFFLRPRVIGYHRRVDQVQAQEAENLDPKPKLPKLYEVWLYFDNGASLPVAKNLHKQQAHQVAVLMKKALERVHELASQSTSPGAAGWVEMVVE